MSRPIEKRVAWLVMMLFLLTSHAEAQVRFFIDGGKPASTVSNGAATTLHAKVTVARAKRTAKFKQMDVALGFEGNLGVHELRVVDAQPAFLKRFKGDDLAVAIVPAAGETGTILSNTRQSLTFKDLVNGAQLESRSQNKLTLRVRGWNISGYTTKQKWDAGRGVWVKTKEPVWKATTLAEGVFEITGIESGKTGEVHYIEAEGWYSAGKYEKALASARAAIKAGVVDAHAVAALAACRLKDRAAALEHFAAVDKNANSIQEECKKQAGIELERPAPTSTTSTPTSSPRPAPQPAPNAPRAEAAERLQFLGATAISSNGKLAAVAGSRDRKGVIQLWKTAGTFVRELLAASSLNDIAFSPDGKKLAGVTSSSDHRLIIWDIAGGTEVLNIELPKVAERLAWSPDGSRLALGTPGGVVVADAGSGKTLAQRSTPIGVRAVLWSRDGKAVIDAAGGTEVWSVGAAQAKPLRDDTSDAADWLALLPDGKTVVTLDQAGWWVIADRSGASPARTINLRRDGIRRVSHMAVSPDGKSMVVLTASQQMLWYRVADGTLEHRWDIDRSPVTFSFSPTGEFLIIGHKAAVGSFARVVSAGAKDKVVILARLGEPDPR